MKKQLLSTSAIALGVAMAAPASAQQWDVSVGGYFNMYVGASDVGGSFDNTGNYGEGTDFDGIQINKNAEIDIKPSITLDNGLTFGADIQYETADGDSMDEVYMYISGDQLGRIVVGSENSAGYLSMVGAPNVGGLPINSGSVSAFVPFQTSGGATFPLQSDSNGPRIVNSFVGAGVSSYTEVGGGTFGNSDIPRISYYTPSFNGLVVGVSYAPGTEPGGDGRSGLVDFDATGTDNVELTDIFDIGVKYSQSFGTTDVTLGARWGTANLDANGATAFALGTSSADPTTWGLGAQVGFGAFTFGASYSENDNDLPGGLLDEEGYTFGVSYDLAGPWSVGLEYLYGEGNHGSGNGKDELDLIKLAAVRDLGPGVSWSIALLYTEVDAADASSGGLLGGADGTDVEATTITTGISLSF